ncbi:MAG: Clp protease N-terminal domain-containing protein [Chloroflexota bacterium]
MIVLKDILISARQEAHRMRHYFLGVEHIFIALLEIKHGLAGTVLEEYGLANDYVIDAVRRKAGKGSKHRLWAGIPNTPRTEVIFDVAQEIARESSRTIINERDLLIAILEENDSIPARVLQSLDIDLLDLKQKAKTVNPVQVATGAFTKIDVSTELKGGLTNEQNFILRRMFQDYARIRVETSLTGGYTDSQLLVVTPFRVGDFSVASVVVKIGPTDAILDEAQRYNRYVKDTLPPLTARLEDKPIAPDSSDMAGLKYTFLTDSAGNPTDMRAKVKEWKGEQLGRWLHQRLYGQFGEKWWKQTRPYRFEAWREYDWLLPPILTLKLTDTDKKPKDAPVLRFPIRRSKLMDLDLGQVIAIDNFIVYKVNPDKGTIRLALSQGESNARAYQIEVQGIDFDKETFFRGEVVDRLVGTVWKTRDDELMGALHKLSPDFEVRNNSITINNAMLPNPVKFYNPLLDAIVMGSISTIHGDLHLGNILIGPSDSAFLIHFEIRPIKNGMSITG